MVKANGLDLGPGVQKPLTPAGESLGVIFGKIFLIAEAQIGGAHGLLNFIWAGQHAAGENIALDEVSIFAIGLKARILDGDDLQSGAPTGFKTAAKFVEKHRPIFLADSLKHFDRHHAIILRLDIAVIAIFQLDFIRQSTFVYALLTKGELLA